MYIYDGTEVEETILENICQSCSYITGVGKETEIRNCNVG